MPNPIQLIPINAAGPAPSQSALTASEHPNLYITAPPDTDLWRKPPSHDAFNAPCYLLNIPATSFRRARVTISAKWTRQYDQGGLVLFLPAWPERTAWVKAGIENYEGTPCVSVVATREASDWSMRAGAKRVTLEIEREAVDATSGASTSLWVYVVEDGVRSAVREVTWVFANEKEAAGMLSVGIYAARPTKEGDDDLQGLSVTFDDLGIDFDLDF